MRYQSLLLALLAIPLAACGGGTSSPAAPSGAGSSSASGTGVSGQGTLTAVVDGVAYSGMVNGASVNNGVLTITSNNAANTVSVNIGAIAAVGTTTVGLPSSTVLNVITFSGAQVAGSWVASATQGTGTLTITSLTSTSASGTFSFQAPPAPAGSGAGATGTKTVTNGVFNVSLTTTGSAGTGGTGSTSSTNRATATINGAAYSGSALGTTAAATGNNPALLLVSTINTQEGIALGFATTLAVGTQTIQPGSPVNANMTVTSGATANGWLAVSSQGSGTITVSTLTSNRATGTFTLTLISTTGQPAKVITNGVFDVSF